MFPMSAGNPKSPANRPLRTCKGTSADAVGSCKRLRGLNCGKNPNAAPSSMISPLYFVGPICRTHLALFDVLSVSGFECFVSLCPVRRAFYALLSETNGFDFVTTLCHHHMTFGWMGWRCFGFVVPTHSSPCKSRVFHFFAVLAAALNAAAVGAPLLPTFLMRSGFTPAAF